MITEARHKLATEIRNILPDVPVFASPPTQVSAPCVVISLRSSDQTGFALWHQTAQMLVIGPSGDNEAAVQALEAMLWKLAVGLSLIYQQPITWDAPGTLTNVGQTYLASAMEVILDLILANP